MVLKYTVKTAVRGLQTHKSRSALTILGIVIGITSIMLIMSLGQGAQNLILSQIQNMGANTLVVMPGRQPSGVSDFSSLYSDSLKNTDVTQLENKNNVPHLVNVMPLVFGSKVAAYGDQVYQPTVFGASDKLADMYKLTVSDGRLFDGYDVESYAPVAVIGMKVKQELFGDMPAVGERIRLGDRSLLVVGVLGSTGQLSFVNFDQSVLLPYTTAQRYIFGINYYNRLVIEADSASNVKTTGQDITDTLRADHNITDPAKDDFWIQTQEDAMKTVGQITSILTLFLAAVAAISLVVGGIGIMNIMLVSVTERTKEIGLRKALGATDKDILRQFLVEAVMLTGTGGVVGIGLGTGFSFALAFVLSKFAGLAWLFSFPLTAALLGIGVAAAVGLVFGLYPARQAAKKSPIEALRYE